MFAGARIEDEEAGRRRRKDHALDRNAANRLRNVRMRRNRYVANIVSDRIISGFVRVLDVDFRQHLRDFFMHFRTGGDHQVAGGRREEIALGREVVRAVVQDVGQPDMDERIALEYRGWERFVRRFKRLFDVLVVGDASPDDEPTARKSVHYRAGQLRLHNGDRHGGGACRRAVDFRGDSHRGVVFRNRLELREHSFESVLAERRGDDENLVRPLAGIDCDVRKERRGDLGEFQEVDILQEVRAELARTLHLIFAAHLQVFRDFFMVCVERRDNKGVIDRRRNDDGASGCETSDEFSVDGPVARYVVPRVGRDVQSRV